MLKFQEFPGGEDRFKKNIARILLFQLVPENIKRVITLSGVKIPFFKGQFPNDRNWEFVIYEIDEERYKEIYKQVKKDPQCTVERDDIFNGGVDRNLLFDLDAQCTTKDIRHQLSKFRDADMFILTLSRRGEANQIDKVLAALELKVLDINKLSYHNRNGRISDSIKSAIYKCDKFDIFYYNYAENATETRKKGGPMGMYVKIPNKKVERQLVKQSKLFI